MLKDIINNKKVTRKEFILSAMSITALFVSSKLPNLNKDKTKISNSYGNHTYGGNKNNA